MKEQIQQNEIDNKTSLTTDNSGNVAAVPDFHKAAPDMGQFYTFILRRVERSHKVWWIYRNKG